jgi:HEAT repeat protein
MRTIGDDMDAISKDLQQALESECATGVEEVVDAKRPEDLERLRALLRSDARVAASLQQSAIHILGRWGDTESAPDIVRLLPSLGERERINAVAALGHVGGDDAESALIDLSTDSSPDVRRFVAYALADLGTPTAQSRLRELRNADPVDFVRTAAKRGLHDQSEQ